MISDENGRSAVLCYNRGMDDDEFESLVSAAIETIPARFIERMKNVAIVTADYPSKEQLRANDVPDGSTLLGLYEGIPLTARGEYYGTGEVLPDRISIFKGPIIEEALHGEGKGWDSIPTREAVERVVRDTVWHEIAHYFGYDDDAILRREQDGTNRST